MRVRRSAGDAGPGLNPPSAETAFFWNSVDVGNRTRATACPSHANEVSGRGMNGDSEHHGCKPERTRHEHRQRYRRCRDNYARGSRGGAVPDDKCPADTDCRELVLDRWTPADLWHNGQQCRILLYDL